MDKSIKTQKKILKKARSIFLAKGYTGARMQEIADAAKANKALLHYYFRSKEGLFLEVCKNELNVFTPTLLLLEQEALPFPEKIRSFCEAVWTLHRKEPHCTPFLLEAFAKHPELMEKTGIPLPTLEKFSAQIEAGMSHGFIPKGQTSHLLLQLLSLSMFYPLCQDFLHRLLPGLESTEVDSYQNQLPSLINRLISEVR